MRSPAGEHDDYELPMLLKGPRDRSEGLPGLSTFAVSTRVIDGGGHCMMAWRAIFWRGNSCTKVPRGPAGDDNFGWMVLSEWNM